jgi:flagellar biosynthetic protein FliQ
MEEAIVTVCQQALVAMLAISAPAAIAALGVGLAVSIAQTATQVQEQTMTYVPKLVAVCAALGLFGPWMLGQLVRLATVLFERVPEAAGW